MENLVDIKFHGSAFDNMRNIFRMAVKSTAEAMHAVNCQTKGALYKKLQENDEKGLMYRVLINGRDFIAPEPLDKNKIETIKRSELLISSNSLKSIDVIPVVEGADNGIGNIIAGVLLIIVGILILPYTGPLGGALIVVGIGLVAAGIISLLTSPPKFEDFREISGGGKASYLFNGPQNRTREGGPVPVGYGRLLVGSQVISEAYVVSDVTATSTLTQ